MPAFHTRAHDVEAIQWFPNMTATAIGGRGIMPNQSDTAHATCPICKHPMGSHGFIAPVTGFDPVEATDDSPGVQGVAAMPGILIHPKFFVVLSKNGEIASKSPESFAAEHTRVF